LWTVRESRKAGQELAADKVKYAKLTLMSLGRFLKPLKAAKTGYAKDLAAKRVEYAQNLTGP